jgi:phosphatidylglycerol:prolipoprotein diacylglycerol transferase
MIAYPTWLKPEIVTLGPLTLRWYGLMYVLGFFLGAWVLRIRARRGLFTVTYAQADLYVNYLFIGMLIGARLIYCTVYNWDQYSLSPIEILYVWQGGLSFHGALLGMVGASALFARKHRLPFYMVTDTLAITAPPGLFFGRWGNFINGELWGRPTDVPWAMVFPRDPSQLPRHPSQIYQSLTEGLLLFLILYGFQAWMLRTGRYRHGLIGGSFLLGYGVFRFCTEFFREPDAQLGLFSGISMGQILCLMMVVAGVGVLWHAMSKMPIFVPKAPKNLG